MLGSGKEDHNQSQLFNKVEQHKVILYIIHLNPRKTGSHNQREGGQSKHLRKLKDKIIWGLK